MSGFDFALIERAMLSCSASSSFVIGIYRGRSDSSKVSLHSDSGLKGKIMLLFSSSSMNGFSRCFLVLACSDILLVSFELSSNARSRMFLS